MSKTQHIQRRMSQRSIREKNLEMVKLYGRRDGDKIVLNRKACLDVLAGLKDLFATVERMAGRGGMVLVESDEGVQITTYALNG